MLTKNPLFCIFTQFSLLIYIFLTALISPSDDSDEDISDQASLKSESDSSEDLNNMVRDCIIFEHIIESSLLYLYKFIYIFIQ